MKPALAWIRANPISVGAVLLAVASIVWLFVIGSDGVMFMDRMRQRGQEIKRLQALQKTPVKIPPAQPDDLERELRIAVNQAAIDQLHRVYKRMDQEFGEIFKLAVELNRGTHVPMVEKLFPEPTDASSPFEAKKHYREVMKNMIGGSSGQPGYPWLQAGRVPSWHEVDRTLRDVEDRFLSDLLVPKGHVGELTATELQELEEKKANAIYTFYEHHARTIQLYADDDIDSPGFPLDVGDWSKGGLLPRMSTVWDGQVGLWIQQDIVEAIARTNREAGSEASVIDATVKRLIRLEVVPGYVGLADSPGGLGGLARRRLSSPSPVVGGTVVPGDAEGQVLDDFSLSMTGRRSNAMYDVRHVRVSLILSSESMPVFFKHLHQVNFMTILDLKMTDVDEYEAMRDGYVYGPQDVVQADMLIETIWLRDWTAALMPESVRDMLGVRAR